MEQRFHRHYRPARYGLDADMLIGMGVLTERDNAKTEADSVQDAMIAREVHEMMGDLCPINVEYDAGRGRFYAPHKYLRFGPISRCASCRKEYRHYVESASV